ncbi:MAG: carboxypeptidase regulatory-like domain-containing protein, partial [Pedobacter sp.]|nr:carboxypeptidase regulatory-like domain-containing protein [Chitinophagaceae bacterium]
MKKIISLLTAFVLFGFVIKTQAQTSQTGKVNGIVTASDKTIDAATVSLLRAKDSSIVKITVSNKDGKFNIEKLINGKYLVSVQSVGHAKYYSEAFELSATKSEYNVKNINLKAAGKQLNDVIVVSKKPLIEQKLDRTIVNVDASVTNVGATALEVLEKSPGISVDKDGNISLKGKSGVMVLVDGKPSYLGAADLANMLRNMTANQLDQIEIMT